MFQFGAYKNSNKEIRSGFFLFIKSFILLRFDLLYGHISFFFIVFYFKINTKNNISLTRYKNCITLIVTFIFQDLLLILPHIFLLLV